MVFVSYSFEIVFLRDHFFFSTQEDKKNRYLGKETSQSWSNDQSYAPSCTNLNQSNIAHHKSKVVHSTIETVDKKINTNSLLTVLKLGVPHGKFQLHRPDCRRNLKMEHDEQLTKPLNLLNIHSKNYLQYETDTLIGPSKPFRLPRRNLVETAIQKLTLRPKRVLKITLKPNKQDCCDKTWN